MRSITITLVAGMLALILVGCAGSDSDDRRLGAFEEGRVALSWEGDWTPETRYEAGTMVTHEGSTFVASIATDEPPVANCVEGCPWELTGRAATEEPAGGNASIMPIEVYNYQDGYDGPLDWTGPDPADPQFEDAVAEWLVKVAPWLIRHQAESGTTFGHTDLEPGKYVVFARGVYVSYPGLGKDQLPQGSTPSFGPLISGMMAVGAIAKHVKPPIGSGPLLATIGNSLGTTTASFFGASSYGLVCKLRVGDQTLDSASMNLAERGTASATLMGVAVTKTAEKMSVGCAHNGAKAGPIVRDLRLVAVKIK